MDTVAVDTINWFCAGTAWIVDVIAFRTAHFAAPCCQGVPKTVALETAKGAGNIRAYLSRKVSTFTRSGRFR